MLCVATGIQSEGERSRWIWMEPSKLQEANTEPNFGWDHATAQIGPVSLFWIVKLGV